MKGLLATSRPTHNTAPTSPPFRPNHSRNPRGFNPALLSTAMHSKPILSNNSINDTAAVSKTEWIEHHFRNRPVRRSFACLWEQTFYDPLTAFPFPPWASLALLFTVLIFIVIGSASIPDRTDGEGVLKKPQEEPKLRAQRRRQNWRPWIGLKIVWLRALPLYR